MLFNSIHFFVFVPIVLLVFFALPERGQRWWLFFVSLYFYAVFRVAFVSLLLYSIGLTYACMVLMHRSDSKRVRQVWLTVAVLGNLAMLLVFKYLHLFYDTLNFVFGIFGPGRIDGPTFLLPMGISFFGLQAVSAAIDVYRGIAPPPKNLLRFGLYKAFFPLLVAGPILRPKELLPQLEGRKVFSEANLREGAVKLALGFFKKTILADALSPIVDQVFATPGDYNSLSMLVAVYVFSFQIYCDFSGYSDIAIGIARVMGYHLPENFERPFFSTSIGEFWRRWHISFSSWLRDYVYIPLGGSRVSVWRAYSNLFATMIVSGLWHGADWNYLVWGGIHGGFMALERLLSRMPRVNAFFQRMPGWLGAFYVYSVFSIAFFYFRCRPISLPGMAQGDTATPLGVGWYMTKRALSFESGMQATLSWNALLLMGGLIALEWSQERRGDIFAAAMRRPFPVYAVTGSILLVCAYIYSVSTSQPFVYFQF